MSGNAPLWRTVVVAGRFEPPTLDRIAARLTALKRRRVLGPRAAVLVGLCEAPAHGPAILLTRRSQAVGTHRGQVALPGGKAARGETPEQTALREAHEEVGVDPRTVHVLGLGHDARSITGLAVTPVVGYLGAVDPANLRRHEGEVDAIFAVGIEALADPTRRHWQRYPLRGRMPVFDAAPWPVWGLTAYILAEFLRDVLDVDDL